jgi:hypothetical protein
MKHYTAKQLAELKSIAYDALQKQLARDAKKPRNQRKYPHARKCECGHGWMIPKGDLTENEQKKSRK